LRRLVDNSFLLGSRERYSSLNVAQCFNLMNYISWITYFASGRWLAMFLSYEANEHVDDKQLIVVEVRLSGD